MSNQDTSLPENPPLVELFSRLREAGLPLGLQEYQLLLTAIQGGHGILNASALRKLCSTLWAKSWEDVQLIEYWFTKIVMAPVDVDVELTVEAFPPEEPLVTDQEDQPDTAITNTVPIDDQETELRSSLDTPAQSPPRESHLERGESPTDRASAHFSTKQPQVPLDVAKYIQTPNTRYVDHNYTHVHISDHYLPITRRQMQRSWRYLRRPVRVGSLVDIDVVATVKTLGQRGMFIEPVLVARRANRAELLLLLDHSSSMVAFHVLAQLLAETASRGGHLGKAGVYYFHNCPKGYLYRDAERVEGEAIHDILNRVHPIRTSVLIFSDGGAARGSSHPMRLQATKQFLQQVKQRARYVAWVNPMPRERWSGSTASAIAEFVPMFELNRRGLDNAVSVLRGHLTMFEV